MRSKRAQVTIFIILGIVILFVVGFLIVSSSDIRRSGLQLQEEDALSRLFQKEGMRLFVEDCLEDQLSLGLRLLGDQGKIWADQEGGIIGFVQNDTGTYFPDEDGRRVTYGARFIGPEAPMYPCNEDCNFLFSEASDERYGERAFLSSTLEGELERYLRESTIACVESFTQEEISSGAEVTSFDAEVNLEMSDVGFLVDVHYPITWQVDSETYFFLSSFDFFYPSEFYPFLKAAVTTPLSFDTQYLDFNFDNETLSQGHENLPVRSEIFTYLDASLSVFNASEGDTVLVASLPYSRVLNDGLGETYSFHIARQNRPPVLEYISHCPIGDYDYLVIPEVDGFNEIRFIPQVIDPDEQSVSIRVMRPAALTTSGEPMRISMDALPLFSEQTLAGPLEEGEEVFFTPGDLARQNFTVVVSDGYREDYQEVNVLHEGQIIANPTFFNEYRDLLFDPASLEDPFCLVINLPERDDARFSFRVGEFAVDLTESANFTIDNEGRLIEGCDYTHTAILSYKGFIETFLGTNDPGAIAIPIIGEVSYVSNDDLTCRYDVDHVATPRFTSCTPYRSDVSAYVPGISELANPFLATNVCCSDSGDYVARGTECARGEFCIDEGEGAGAYLYDYVAQCSGNRGNVCGEELLSRTQAVIGQHTCGGPDITGCSAVDPTGSCYGVEAWGLGESDGDVVGWCHGGSGCASFCGDESGESLVYTNTGGRDAAEDFTSYESANFACGCVGRVGQPCDSNFDGVFEGQCKTDTECSVS